MTSAATLSIEEKLVLAQLVYVHGDADWTTITSAWTTHHAVKNKGVNDPQMIHATWEEVVMTAAPRLGLADAASMNAPMAKGSPVAMQFARLFFQDRLYELRDAILAKETEFKNILGKMGGFKTIKTEEQPIVPTPFPPRSSGPLNSTSSSSLSPPPDSSPQPSQGPQVATIPPTPAMDDLTPVPQEEPKAEAEDGTTDSMEVDGPQQKTPTRPTFETRPTKPKEETEVEELVKLLSTPGSEAGDQEMDGSTVIKEEEGEREDTVEDAVKDKEEEEEEQVPVSKRLRRSKKDFAQKEKVETEITPPKARKGHKKGAPSQTSPVSPRATRGRRGTDAHRPATPVTVATDEADGEGEPADTKSDSIQGPAEDDASVADSTQQTETRATRTTRASKRKAAEMDPESPVENTRSKRKAGEKAPTAEQEEPPQTPVTATPSKQFIKAMSALVDQLQSSEYSDPFKRAVTLKDAPDYNEVVKKPTDLTAIGKKVKAGTVRSWEELERELWLMMANCYVYNRPGSEVLDAANSMMNVIKAALKDAREK